MKKLLLLGALCALSLPILADEKAPQKSWLSERGLLSAAEVNATLGENLSPQAREKMEKALAARNAEVEAANAKFSAVLRELLGADDTTISKRVQDKTEAQKEAEELARIKRRQPSRYNEIMRRKQKEAEEAAKAENAAKKAS